MSDWTARLLTGAMIGAAIALAMSLFGDFDTEGVILQAQDVIDAEQERVTEDELNLYIDVYKAMQADRSLKIADAVAQRDMTVEEFRALERRVQLQERLIERVREALLEHAKENATGLGERGVTVHN